MFIIALTYKKPITEIQKHIEEHDLLLTELNDQGKLIFSARKNPRTGGIIVVRNVTVDDVQKIIERDPFKIYEVADYDVTEVIPRKFAKAFECFIETEL